MRLLDVYHCNEGEPTVRWTRGPTPDDVVRCDIDIGEDGFTLVFNDAWDAGAFAKRLLKGAPPATLYD